MGSANRKDLGTADVDAARDHNNYKPYRTSDQKAEARRLAKKVDGRFISSAPVSRHAVRQDLMGQKVRT